MKRRHGRSKRRTKKYKKAHKLATIGTVKRLLHADIEKKWIATTSAPAPTSAAVSRTLINGMQQGDTRLLRTGNQIKMHSYELRAWFQAAGGIPDGCYVRCVVMLDTQSDAAVPTNAQMFSDGTVANQVFSPRNPDYLRRYKFLFDRTYRLNTLAGTVFTVATGVYTTFSEEQKFIHIKLNLKDKLVQYNDTNAGDQSDIIKNSLWQFWFCDIGTAPVMNQFQVFKFIDA